MQTPEFWYKSKPSFFLKLFNPIGYLISKIGHFRFLLKKGYKGKTPIICIGNITAGGTGKTPTAILLAKIAQCNDLNIAFLTRGYGGDVQGLYQVTEGDHYQKTGDEALILFNHAPTFIAKNRIEGANYIDSLNEFDLIICDDGLQNHPDLSKQFGIVTVDASRFFGNGLLVPFGPLREPVNQGINKASIILLIGNIISDQNLEILKKFNKPIIQAHKEPLRHGIDLNGESVIAFSGLGNNEQFQMTLEQSGADIVKMHAFEDHYAYSNRIIERLVKDAQEQGALLVTTEKDMVKIDKKFYRYIVPMLIELSICDEDYQRLEVEIKNLTNKRLT